MVFFVFIPKNSSNAFFLSFMRSTSNAPDPDRNVEKDDFKTNTNESDVTFHRIYTIFTGSVSKNNNIQLVLSSFVYRCLKKNDSMQVIWLNAAVPSNPPTFIY